MINLMKEAHKLTREIKAEYKDVDYKAQLGICISYLSKKEEVKEMVKLEGTEKQVKFASDIRKNIINMIEESDSEYKNELLEEAYRIKQAVWFIGRNDMMKFGEVETVEDLFRPFLKKLRRNKQEY